MAIPIANIIKELFTGGVTDLIDEVVTSKEEKLILKNKLRELEIEHTRVIEDNITERWRSDMTSDNKLSKNVRPMSLIVLAVVFFIISFMDGNIGSFTLADGYKPIYQSLLLLTFGAYFGDRAVRGYTNIKNKNVK